MTGSEDQQTYLGFDFSTQQVSFGNLIWFDLIWANLIFVYLRFKLKAVAINDNLEIICEACVHFDFDLPEFRYNK